MKKKILITGSEGLIGGAIKKIINKKIYTVKSIDIKGRKKIDISKKKFINYLNKFNPDIIIHAAAHPGGLSMHKPLKNITINLLSTFKIIDWCSNNRKKLIFLSSSAVYRSSKKGNKEIEKLDPRTIYGINKVACENYIYAISKFKKFDWIIFRLFATYGSGHQPNLYQGIVNIITTQFKNSSEIIIKGSLKRERDLIYVDDVAKIINKALSFKKYNNQIFNVGTGKSTSIKRLIKEINKLFKKKIVIKVLTPTFGDPHFSISNNIKLKKYFKIKKFISLSDGLRKTIN